jgi:Cu/Ag efflux protein CusF
MRNQIIALTTFVAVMSGAVAMASTTTQGTIKSIDMATHAITLSDGSVYKLPAAFKDPGLKVGEKVAVVWDAKGGMNEATAVTIVK